VECSHTISCQTTSHTGVKTDQTKRTDHMHSSSFHCTVFSCQLSHQLQTDLDDFCTWVGSLSDPTRSPTGEGELTERICYNLSLRTPRSVRWVGMAPDNAQTHDLTGTSRSSCCELPKQRDLSCLGVHHFASHKVVDGQFECLFDPRQKISLEILFECR